jgi:hypothetical protein
MNNFEFASTKSLLNCCLDCEGGKQPSQDKQRMLHVLHRYKPQHWSHEELQKQKAKFRERIPNFFVPFSLPET